MFRHCGLLVDAASTSSPERGRPARRLLRNQKMRARRPQSPVWRGRYAFGAIQTERHTGRCRTSQPRHRLLLHKNAVVLRGRQPKRCMSPIGAALLFDRRLVGLLFTRLRDTPLTKVRDRAVKGEICLNIPELFPILRVSVWIELWMRAGDASPVLEDAE